jgi:hypothetical protein
VEFEETLPEKPPLLRRESSHFLDDGRLHFTSEEVKQTEKQDPWLPVINLIANIQLLDLPVLVGTQSCSLT